MIIIDQLRDEKFQLKKSLLRETTKSRDLEKQFIQLLKKFKEREEEIKNITSIGELFI